MKQHSPGPWRWGPNGTYDTDDYWGNKPALFDANNQVVLHFGDDTEYYPSAGMEPELEADTTLIAAAPGLLEALQSIANSACCSCCQEAALVAKKAIAKAQSNLTK